MIKNNQSNQNNSLQLPESAKGKLFEFEVVTITGVAERTVKKEKKVNGFLAGILGKKEVVEVQEIQVTTDKKLYQSYFQTEDLKRDVVLEMVYIPGGNFTMGSPTDEKGRESWYKGSESPQHQVNVPEFYMSKYPITQKQYEALIAKNPARFRGDDKPIEQVSWEDAVSFCEKLSKHTGGNYRLPSEAEWEYACRAGTTTPFCYGETISSNFANYDGDFIYAFEPKGEYRDETTEVGIFSPNAFGLYDMHGNVWEWCADPWHDNYEGATTDGSVWDHAKNKKLRVLRGGSWDDYPNNSRSAERFWCCINHWNSGNGFRVVCSI
ncbi:MAG: formylglycine-generating enzyme family protein [Thiomargarita sp.]|nr:formylglycine-generating enzyme family protein [Thiomargarita sp.]